ncbi:hypothetical protein SMD11_2782 [Streptomyces albireticuli]|uniref:Uncharacterized protein n=1 Tax=Streptomyces albireticuli TaxID=1940 RepID=A0A1Z2L2B5_9ACTN|nr:hypothetical protein SMD11_2782 [Streptomyces albireticuli]
MRPDRTAGRGSFRGLEDVAPRVTTGAGVGDCQGKSWAGCPQGGAGGGGEGEEERRGTGEKGGSGRRRMEGGSGYGREGGSGDQGAYGGSGER